MNDCAGDCARIFAEPDVCAAHDGFPIDWMERLASPRLAAAIDEVRALEEHSLAQARAILESLDGISRSGRRKLKRGIPVGNSVRLDGARPMIVGGFTAVSWRAAHFPWTVDGPIRCGLISTLAQRIAMRSPKLMPRDF